MMSSNSTLRSGGQLMVESLGAHGVETVFCVPGESYLEVLDALVDTDGGISVVTCRHEHGAANMAEAYAKLTGRVGVCMVTRGPGACNASIGVHTAFQDSTPMVLLIGQVPRDHAGREAFQEVDFERMFEPLAKWAVQIEQAEDIPETMARAFQTAQSNRPGPVVVALPEDMLHDESDVSTATALEIIQAEPDPSDMVRLHRMLKEAKRPVMLVGGGGWNTEARRDIVTFAEANHLPTCCSFRRHHAFDNDSPCFVGEMGIGVEPGLVDMVKQADLVLVIGARLGEMTSQRYTLINVPNPSQQVVHVYPGVEELGRVFTPALAIHAGTAAFAKAAAGLEPVNGDHRRDRVKEGRRGYELGRTIPAFEGALDLGAIMAELDASLPDDAVVTVDAGNFSGWPQRFIGFGGGRVLLGPTSGAMGYAVPAAIAAKIAAPERVVVSCVGDGGFGMTGQEIAPAMVHGASPIILVFNNGMYGTIRMHQERNHPNRIIATDLRNPDFAALAETYGAHGEAVERTADFGPAFERASNAGKVALIELRMDPNVITTRTTLDAIRQQAIKNG